jgi:hypothetical protein
MKVEITYQWSELDKNHQFGISLKEGENNIHYNWAWYYLGKFMADIKPKNIAIYPYSVGKQIASYKYHDANKIALLIRNKIIKQYNLLEI